MEKAGKHILVIRLSAMGDVAMTVPVINAMVRMHPEVKITVVSRAFFKPIFQHIPNVSFYAADVKGTHKGVLGLFKLYKELKKLKIDLVADMHNVLRSKLLRFYFSFGKYNIASIDKGRADKKALTKAEGKVFKQLKTTHERYADVFTKLGYSLEFTKEDVLPQLKMTENIAEFIGKSTKKCIGIAPFAAFAGKTYPASQMEVVISKLNATNQYTIILFGGSADATQLSTWQETYEHVQSCAGVFSFEEELKLISNLDLMLSMDSGNAHLAAMFGRKVVTIWGVTHPYAGFYPFGQPEEYALLADRSTYPLLPTSIYGNKYPEGYENVMQTITPEAVFDKILDVV
ncbi:lipopolysaccharide core biosynthesis protein [Kordia sp. SMS9]|uniref:glycosyltransferase family 9 protein n=1 Tax=Kordia sp. SMS9 TaxID=2282170 RepID=UPI000E1092BD|nr:glycosyltransferase family 9 protein [Kordia sp. SMS9]AXG68997.1 lipopolysaccharide core biosynthesis protein [Kordia sp. SMS9]